MHVSTRAEEVSSAFALPALAGIGAGAAAAGNHIVLVGATFGAVAVITRAIARVWHWSRDRWRKLDEIRDHSDEVPALRAEVSAMRAEFAEVRVLLEARRNPNARTRVDDWKDMP